MTMIESMKVNTNAWRALMTDLFPASSAVQMYGSVGVVNVASLRTSQQFTKPKDLQECSIQQ